jgi:hypothetical protein
MYPKAGWLLINVPVANNTTYHQYVVNTITGAACKFTGMNASTWGMYNNNLYFGGMVKFLKPMMDLMITAQILIAMFKPLIII